MNGAGFAEDVGKRGRPDIENQKLYKMFMKHVVPSERCMGRNITVFIEQWVPTDIRNFAKIVVDTCRIEQNVN